MPTAITPSMPAMIIMICQKRRASLTMYAASCRGWRKVAYPNEARASAAIFPLCNASPVGDEIIVTWPLAAGLRDGQCVRACRQSNRSWLVSSRPALERLRLQPPHASLIGGGRRSSSGSLAKFDAERRASSRVSRFGRRAVRRSEMSEIGGEPEAYGLRLKRH
jgi:hypothetical protein